MFAERVQSLFEILIDVFAFFSQLEEDVDVFLFLMEGIQELEVALQPLFFLLERQRPLLVLPDFGSAELPAEGFDSGFFPVEVKETPGALRI
jgi:hypothetical protein